MEGVALDDPAYFTLDHDWTLLGFLTYRQRLDDFQYGNGFEHSRYSSNLATICEWEEASEAVMKKACQALSVFPKEKKSNSVATFWRNATAFQQSRLERATLTEQQHTVIVKTTFQQDQIVRDNFTKHLESLQSVHEKRKFNTIAGETSTSRVSSRAKMDAETVEQAFSLTDSENEVDSLFVDSHELLPEEERAVVEEKDNVKVEQDWKKWGADLLRAAKRSTHKHCPENYGIIRCGSGIQCSKWMSKKLYQSLQSSLQRIDRAPFADYGSSISDIMAQECLEGMLEALRLKAPPVNESRGSKYYILDRVFNQFARDVFMSDDSPSDIGASEVCYNHLALWPCMYAAVSGLTFGLGNAKFFPGEIYLKATDEIQKLRHEPDPSRMKVDGVVRIDFAQIELLSMEVTGHHGLHDNNRAGWDHAKGFHATLAMLSRIAYAFMHGSVELFHDIKVVFVHAHETFLHLWLFNMSSPGIFVMQRIAKAKVPAKFEEAFLLCELINFFWTLRVEISKTMKALVRLKASHVEKAIAIKVLGERRGQYLYETLKPVVTSQRTKIVTAILDKKEEYAGVGEYVLPGSSPTKEGE